MTDKPATSASMSPSLDPRTIDAGARGDGREPGRRIGATRERMQAARGAGVPALWMEELLLQSFLNVGYPLTLAAFAIWRDVAGPVPAEGG